MANSEELNQEDQSHILSSKLTRRSMLAIAGGITLLPVIGRYEYLTNRIGINSEANAAHSEPVNYILSSCKDVIEGNGGQCDGCLESIGEAFTKMGYTELNILLDAASAGKNFNSKLENYVSKVATCVLKLEGGSGVCLQAVPPRVLAITVPAFALCLASIDISIADLKNHVYDDLYVLLIHFFETL